MVKKSTIVLFMLIGMATSAFAQRTGYNVPNGVYRSDCEPQNISESVAPTDLKINTIQGRSGGTGTEADPFIIASIDDFNEMATRVTNGTEAQGTIFPNGNTGYAGQYFKMSEDLSADGIVQVGDNQHPFFGNFDGDNHDIKGINATYGEYGGLFCFLGNGSSVSNLSMYGEVTCSIYSGVLASAAQTGSTVTNVHNYANLTTSAYYAGGIVGASYGRIVGCTNSGNMTSPTDFIGGIVGDCYFDVYDCVNTGDITGQTSTGGIVGYSARHNISRCVNAGNIYGNQAYTGGVIGFCVNYDNPDLICSYLINTGEVVTGSAAVIGRLWVEGTEESHALNCYYDKQNCDKFGYKPGNDQEGIVEPRYASEMVGDGLAEQLGDDWTFGENVYPTPTAVAETEIATCAAAPAFFSYTDGNNFDRYNTLRHDFAVNEDNEIQWFADSDIIEIESGNVRLLEQGACIMTATVGNASKRYNLIVEQADDVAENEFSSLAIYPNPANDYVMIDNSNVKNVKIYNANGQCVMNVNLENSTSRIDVTSLESGIYVLQTIDNDGAIAKSKITVVR